MKDSGIPWLGEIPAHWEVKKIKYLTNYIGSGKTPRGGSEVYQKHGVVLLRSQNVHNECLKLDDAVYINQELDTLQANSRVKKNDILLNITGASLGRCYYADESLLPANVNQHVCIIRPLHREINFKFLHLILVSQYLQSQIQSLENGSSREGLNFKQIGNLAVVIPPIHDQNKILSFVEDETKRIDKQNEQNRNSVSKLKEYRSSLITHAVTGKIDVREHIPQTAVL